MVAAVPTDEAARQAKLGRYATLDAPDNRHFDRITRLASDVCEAPIALVSLVAGEGLSLKSTVGLDPVRHADGIRKLRDARLCSNTVRQDGILIVPDVTTDERFCELLHDVTDPKIGTYMGAPLTTREGDRIGSLCVLYPTVTSIRDIWKERLTDLAAMLTADLESRLALADAEENERKIRHVIESMGAWIWETDENHRYTYHSDNGASRIFPSSQLIGRARWEFPGVDTDLTQFETLKEIFERHDPFRDFEYYFVDRHGNRQHRKVSGNPVFAEDGSFRGYRGTSSNINKRVETVEGLEAATVAAEQANAAKSDLLANISHELRTPLNAIIGFSDMILSAEPEAFSRPQHADYMNNIRTSGEDLLNVVDGLLDPSKSVADHADLNEARVHVPTALQESVRRLAFQAEAAGLAVTTIHTDDLPLLLADERKLTQILINLLSNAIKFTPAGGMITLSADFTPETGHIIKVSDTGVGLAPDRFDKVLVPLRQAASGVRHKFDGTGLGLPLSASYAEMHGGALKIMSEVGTGTTVEIRLPPERAVPAENADTDTALGLDQALQLISTEEHTRSCLITDPRLPDNPIVYVTPEFEKVSGYPKSEVLGRNCRFLQGPMSDPETVAIIRQAVESFSPVTAELINYRKDGTPFRNRLSIRPVFDNQGVPTSFVAVQSVSELDELEMQDFARHPGPGGS